MATQAPLPKNQVDINELAKQVFEDADRAKRWLHQPNVSTDNKPPIELLDQPEGRERVRSLLLRIEYGVLA
jgi:putative toxin-antitoxin system antitoxin component (TIGR02293 family)